MSIFTRILFKDVVSCDHTVVHDLAVNNTSDHTVVHDLAVNYTSDHTMYGLCGTVLTTA